MINGCCCLIACDFESMATIARADEKQKEKEKQQRHKNSEEKKKRTKGSCGSSIISPERTQANVFRIVSTQLMIVNHRA